MNLKKYIGKKLSETPDQIIDWFPVCKNGIIINFIQSDGEAFLIPTKEYSLDDFYLNTKIDAFLPRKEEKNETI